MIHSTNPRNATLTATKTAIRPQQLLPVLPNAKATDAIDAAETALIVRCKAGDSAAWNTLIKRYETSVFRFAYSLSHSQEDADDIAGRVFLRLYSNINTFRYESSFRSWLFRIVRNTYVDMCVRSAYRKNISLDSMPGSDGESVSSRDIIDPQAGPEEKYLDKETASLLNHAIRHLPEYQRQVVQMYHIEGKSYGTIASTAGLSIATVKSRLNRARTNLRERLTPMRDTLMEA
jgi:RNA polymerase sigma-70 factor (ECF subfamily)